MALYPMELKGRPGIRNYNRDPADRLRDRNYNKFENKQPRTNRSHFLRTQNHLRNVDNFNISSQERTKFR